jgi:hypothetical protein
VKREQLLLDYLIFIHVDSCHLHQPYLVKKSWLIEEFFLLLTRKI